MSQRSLTTAGLVLGSMLAAWLRFDVGSLPMSWSVVVICFGGAVASWIVQSRRLPRVELPDAARELGAREHLTAAEEARFKDSLRAWHSRQQRDAWRDIERNGPGPLIGARTVFYFLWLSLFAVVALPSAVVPNIAPQVPRFVVLQSLLAATAAVVATPLGVRDWKRARTALSRQ